MLTTVFAQTQTLKMIKCSLSRVFLSEEKRNSQGVLMGNQATVRKAIVRFMLQKIFAKKFSSYSRTRNVSIDFCCVFRFLENGFYLLELQTVKIFFRDLRF